MKPDELAPLRKLQNERPTPEYKPWNVEPVFDALEMSHKRGFYILEKWTETGLWEY